MGVVHECSLLEVPLYIQIILTTKANIEKKRLMAPKLRNLTNTSPSSQSRTNRLTKMRKPVADLLSSTISTTLSVASVVSMDTSEMATHAATRRANDRTCTV